MCDADRCSKLPFAEKTAIGLLRLFGEGAMNSILLKTVLFGSAVIFVSSASAQVDRALAGSRVAAPPVVLSQSGLGLRSPALMQLAPSSLRSAREHASRMARRDTAQYTIVDAPGAGGGIGQGTLLFGINSLSAAVGSYSDDAGVFHGFERMPDGTYIKVDVGKTSTALYAINDKGLVGGVFVDRKTGRCPGFVSTAKGKLKKFDPPDDSGLWPDDCLFDGPLNNSGTIVGGYYGGGSLHSFSRLKNGDLTEFDPPGFTYSQAIGINDAGEISGSDADGTSHGYIRAGDGPFTEFDPPNAVWAFAGPINDEGEVEGDFQESNLVYRGYIREPDGSFTVYDAPDAGAASGQGTLGATGINKAGTAAGVYIDADGYPHGYTRAKDGTFAEFDVPGSIATYPFGPSGINDSGVTTGFFIDQWGGLHGFLRTP
jgi:hypothetical protein